MTERADRAGPGGIRPTEQPLSGDEAAEAKAGRPPYGADDGKSGGRTQGGMAGTPTSSAGSGDGTNAQRGGASGTENDRDAPGASTHKKADDLR